MSSHAIAAGSTVLVTGVNGYIAAHVADQLLQAGYRVRGTVRDLSKAADLQTYFDKTYGQGKFEVTKVEDIVSETAFTDAVKGVSGIAHLSSPMYWGTDPNAAIPIGVGGTLSALKAAVSEPSVKRVVVTSSVAAVDRSKPGLITADSWNTDSIKSAWSGNPAPGAVYRALKTTAEQEAWKFVKEQKPSFALNTVLPGFCFGLSVVGPPASSGHYPNAVLKGDYNTVKAFGNPGIFVDVRDVARLHVGALISPNATGHRYFGTTSSFTWKSLAETLHKVLPDKKFPLDGWSDVQSDNNDFDNALAGELLKELGRPGWISLEETLKDY